MVDGESTDVRIGDELSLFIHDDTGEVWVTDCSEGRTSHPVNRAEGYRLLESARANILREQARLAEEQVRLSEELRRCTAIEIALDGLMEQRNPSPYRRKLIPAGLI